MEQQKTKTCARCGVEHPISFFRKKGKSLGQGYITQESRREAICKECEMRERQEKRDSNPFRPKARATIAAHARKECMSAKQFSHKYGITIDYVEMLFRDAWLLHNNGGKCYSCYKPFNHNLDDFTLDKIFPDRPPTRSNLRIICRTCNTAKGSRDPIDYDFDALEFDRNKEAVARGVQFTLPKPELVPAMRGNQFTLL